MENNRTVGVIIPTMKTSEQVSPQICEMMAADSSCGPVFVPSLKASASVNRNAGLDHFKDVDVIVMVDDDIRQFPDNWLSNLVDSLGPDCSMVSARLLNRQGQPGAMLGNNLNLEPSIVYSRELPTACVAFWNSKLRFDEGFRGSGFEDTYFCWLLRQVREDGKFATNNRVAVVHLNKQTAQNDNFDHNRLHFNKLTGENR